jgi:hypothetical protein
MYEFLERLNDPVVEGTDWCFVSCRLDTAVVTCSSVKSCLATRHEGTWGERRYSSYSFLTSALDGGEWSASRPGRALPPGKEPPVPILQEAWWASEPVWSQGLEEKSSAPVGDRTAIIQPVVRHYTDRATAAPNCSSVHRTKRPEFGSLLSQNTHWKL